MILSTVLMEYIFKTMCYANTVDREIFAVVIFSVYSRCEYINYNSENITAQTELNILVFKASVYHV